MMTRPAEQTDRLYRTVKTYVGKLGDHRQNQGEGECGKISRAATAASFVKYLNVLVGG